LKGELQVHPDPIVRRFHTAALAGVPACLWGPPGSGKTARLFSYAEVKGLKLEEGLERWLLSRCESIDLKPRIFSDGKVLVVDPPELARLKARLGGGILFLDELNRSTKEVEGAALDIIDRPPPGITIFAACNPQTRGQAARNLGSAAANRFCHLEVATDAAAFASAMLSGWPSGQAGDFNPPEVEKLQAARAKVAFRVSSFIRRRQELLEAEPTDPVKAGKAWPSSRTWQYLVQIEAVALALDLAFEDRQALISGCIGDGPGTEFLAFCQDADLVDPEACLRDPNSFAPDRGRVDRTIAALTSIAGAVQSNFTDPRWKAAWACISRCVEFDQKDAGVVGSDLLVALFGGLTPDKKQGLTSPVKLIPTPLAAILASK